ncbi:unnamed protein product [Symbiodinium necroappetens]|uniref:Uncharacterized protein n=1 Tax=Symbiodinium necroappetens TaxID=1628268 RepID=A0A812ZQ38_9DINO|nr:unnamed protein product [Symbiodinium necroappetens]
MLPCRRLRRSHTRPSSQELAPSSTMGRRSAAPSEPSTRIGGTASSMWIATRLTFTSTSRTCTQTTSKRSPRASTSWAAAFGSGPRCWTTA